MSSYRICKTCSAWVWFDNPHKCPPVWIVADESSPSDMRSVYATDTEDAATKWAEDYDSEEGYLTRGNEMVLLVGRAGGEIVRVAVSGEMVPSYTARELGPATNPAESSLSDFGEAVPPLSATDTQSK